MEAILTTAGRAIILITIAFTDRVCMVTRTIRIMLTTMLRTVIETMVTRARLVVQTTQLDLATEH
jgi:hypothetical protein